MRAVVLAGGKGTRLRPLTYTKPKPLLPLAGKPAIVHLIQKLTREGIDEIVVTTNYFANQLHKTVGDGSEYGIRIRHVEEKSPLGTAGSVKNSESFIDDTFVVIQGDNQFEFGFGDIMNHHRKLGAIATIALTRVENPSEYGIVELSDGRVTRFLEKPSPSECFSNLINTGIYVLEPEALKLIPEGKPFDFSRDMFPHMLKSREVLAGFPVIGFWIDVGDPRSYLKANVWTLDNLEPTTTRNEHDAKAWSDNAISEAVTIRRPIHLGKNVRIQKGAVVGPYACVGDGSEILENTKIAFSVVYENTHIGRNTALDTCVVAENCWVGDRVQIDRDTVVGAGTELGEGSHLTAESRVGPFAVVQPHAVVEGTVTAFEKDIERICSLIEKSNTGIGLTNEEARVCGALCELGETDSKTVAHMSRIPHPRALSILIGLEERGIVASFGSIPKTYALTREKVRSARGTT